MRPNHRPAGTPSTDFPSVFGLNLPLGASAAGRVKAAPSDIWQSAVTLKIIKAHVILSAFVRMQQSAWILFIDVIIDCAFGTYTDACLHRAPCVRMDVQIKVKESSGSWTFTGTQTLVGSIVTLNKCTIIAPPLFEWRCCFSIRWSWLTKIPNYSLYLLILSVPVGTWGRNHTLPLAASQMRSLELIAHTK